VTAPTIPVGSRCAPARRVLTVAHLAAAEADGGQWTVCDLDLMEAGELWQVLPDDRDPLCPACDGTSPDQPDLFGGDA
jgi:hypothetical protein